MACLNMLKNEQQQQQQQGPHGHGSINMAPRISFSNDFADTHAHHTVKRESGGYREAPVSSDFEFSVSGYAMISADELFFKGKLLPAQRHTNSAATTTVRDELLLAPADDDDTNIALHSPRVTKGISMRRWKERLGLKRSHHDHHIYQYQPSNSTFDHNINNIPPHHHHELLLQRIDETTTTLSFHDDPHYAVNSD